MISPQHSALLRHPSISVSEEKLWWIKGTIDLDLTNNPVSFELSFEQWSKIPVKRLILPRMPISYLGLFAGRRNLAEYQFGVWFLKPKDLDTQRSIVLICSLLEGTTPMAIDNSHRTPRPTTYKVRPPVIKGPSTL